MRVTLIHPLIGMADGERVYVVDASLTGIRMSHARMFEQLARCVVAFSWDGKPIELVGKIRWTTPHPFGVGVSYQSGVEIADIRPQAHFALQSLIESQVERAQIEKWHS